MAKRMAWMIAALVLVFGGIVAYNQVRSYFIKQYFASFEPPPVTISTTHAKSQVWQPFMTAVGTLVAQNGVTISAESQGLVGNILFNSGQIVHKGDVLVTLRDKVEQADLKNAQASLKLAKLSYDRQKDLFKRKATFGAAVDKAAAQFQQAQANAEHAKAVLDQKHITAPFDGKIGICLVSLGEYISAGKKIVSLQDLDPLYSNFSLPEQQLHHLHRGQVIKLHVEAQPKQEFSGLIIAINSTVDPKTHTIAVQATVPNSQGLLYPGMFANIRILQSETVQVISVPQTAITYSLYGDTVFVIKPKGKNKNGKPILIAKKVYVTAGRQRSDRVAINSGLKVGDQVVTSGQLKLQDNSPVIINNKVQLSHSNS